MNMVLSRLASLTGALDKGVRHERLSLDLPDGMVVEPIKDGETLQDLLLRGDIDALLAQSAQGVPRW